MIRIIPTDGKNKITIAKDETRIKLNGIDAQRIETFARQVDETVRTKTDWNGKTLRGMFNQQDGYYHVVLTPWVFREIELCPQQ